MFQKGMAGGSSTVNLQIKAQVAQAGNRQHDIMHFSVIIRVCMGK